jgi:replication factor A1
MSELITPGIISRLAHAQSQDEALFASQPVVQFLSIKPVDKQASAQPERYRIIISDGAYYIQAMLATQLNALVNDGTVGKHSIVRLERFTVSTVKDKRSALLCVPRRRRTLTRVSLAG